jgi:hypothetical protein
MSKDDLQILDEYIKEKEPYMVLNLPDIAAAELNVTPDEIRTRWKNMK